MVIKYYKHSLQFPTFQGIAMAVSVQKTIEESFGLMYLKDFTSIEQRRAVTWEISSQKGLRIDIFTLYGCDSP